MIHVHTPAADVAAGGQDVTNLLRHVAISDSRHAVVFNHVDVLYLSEHLGSVNASP